MRSLQIGSTIISLREPNLGDSLTQTNNNRQAVLQSGRLVMAQYAKTSRDLSLTFDLVSQDDADFIVANIGQPCSYAILPDESSSESTSEEPVESIKGVILSASYEVTTLKCGECSLQITLALEGWYDNP